VTSIAVFSDLHGNTPALEAFLSVVAAEEPDLVVDLGDIASGGVDPRGTLDRLRELPDVVTVRGNHERQLLELPRESLSASDRLALDRLGEADRAWLRSLPTRAEVVPGVLAFHGAPADDLCYLLETVEPDGLREATDAEVLERLGDDAGRYAVYLCGHTHLQRTRRLPDGSLVVNPGSLGWPAYSDDKPCPHVVEAGSPHARFAILRQEPAGWQVSQHAIEYDVEAAAAMAAANGRPDVVRALRTGRV
jgi:predicted phosphodiesterase